MYNKPFTAWAKDDLSNAEREADIQSMSAITYQSVRAIELANLTLPTDAEYHSYTTLDVIDALHTVGEVVRQRLQFGKDSSPEYRNDDKTYNQLFNSIGHEIKEATRIQFSSEGHVPRFVNTFNNIVVEFIMHTLKFMGPHRAYEQISIIIARALDSLLIDIQNDPTSILISRNVLIKFRGYRKQICSTSNSH